MPVCIGERRALGNVSFPPMTATVGYAEVTVVICAAVGTTADCVVIPTCAKGKGMGYFRFAGGNGFSFVLVEGFFARPVVAVALGRLPSAKFSSSAVRRCLNPGPCATGDRFEPTS
jgi:hypothetical protein